MILLIFALHCLNTFNSFSQDLIANFHSVKHDVYINKYSPKKKKMHNCIWIWFGNKITAFSSNISAPCGKPVIFPIYSFWKMVQFLAVDISAGCTGCCSSAASLPLHEHIAVKTRSYLQILKTDILTDGLPVSVLFAVTPQVFVSCWTKNGYLWFQDIFYKSIHTKKKNPNKLNNKHRNQNQDIPLFHSNAIIHYVSLYTLQLENYLGIAKR